MTTIALTLAEALANSTLTFAEALELAEADLAPERRWLSVPQARSLVTRTARPSQEQSTAAVTPSAM